MSTISFSVNNCNVVVSTVPATPLFPRSSMPIGITVAPLTAGAFTCKLRVANNDCSEMEDPYVISILGTATANIGSCGIGGFTLRNANRRKLAAFGASPGDMSITVGGDPNVVSGNGFVSFSIGNHVCTITTAGPFTIQIQSVSPATVTCDENAPELEAISREA